MPSDPRRSFDDDPQLHVGLDRELDLAAERPATDSSHSSRGPGLMVAAIVASSLALSGVISLARGERQGDAEDPSAVEPEPSARSAVVRTPTPPASDPPAPTQVRPSAGLESVRTKPTLAASMSSTPSPPAEIMPAAIASPQARRRTPERERETRRSMTEPEPRYQLPAPTFDEPTTVGHPPSAVSPAFAEPSPTSENPSTIELKRESEHTDRSEDEVDAQAPARDPTVEPPLPGRSRAEVPPESAIPSAPAPELDPLPV